MPNLIINNNSPSRLYWGNKSVSVVYKGDLKIYPVDYDAVLVYDVVDTTEATRLFNYIIYSPVEKMFIDDVEVTPTTSYTFDTLGEHKVGFIFKPKEASFANFCDGCSTLKRIEEWSYDMRYVTQTSSCFENCSALVDITPIANWKVYGLMNDFFKGCSSLTDISALANWNTEGVRKISNFFDGCSSLTNIEALKNWNTDRVELIYNLFNGCSSLTDISPLANWNVGKVTSLENIFQNCSSLTSIDALTNWNVENVTTLQGAFNGCSNLTSISALANWNTSSMTDLYRTFKGCSKITSIEALSNWKTENLNSLNETFRGCSKLASIEPIANWNTENLSDMYFCFYGCSSLVNADLSKWDLKNVTNMTWLFNTCTKLESLSMNSELNPNLVVQSMFGSVKTNGTFYYNGEYDYSKILDELPSTWTAVNVNAVAVPVITPNGGEIESTTEITITCATEGATILYSTGYLYEEYTGPFTIDEDCIVMAYATKEGYEESDVAEARFTIKVPTIPYDAVLVYDVTSTTSSTTLFYSSSIISQMYVDDVEVTETTSYTFDTLGEHKVGFIFKPNQTYFSNMFKQCNNLKRITHWSYDMSNVTSLYQTFYNCSELSDISALTNWNVGNVTTLYQTFQGCSALSDISPLANWNTSNVTNLSSTFNYCSNLTDISPLANWNTENVTSLYQTFSRCAIVIADLSNWVLNKVTNMNNMFSYCKNLTSVTMKSAPSANVTTTNMFKNVTTNGTFYYDATQDFSNILNALPSSWTSVDISAS